MNVRSIVAGSCLTLASIGGLIGLAPQQVLADGPSDREAVSLACSARANYGTVNVRSGAGTGFPTVDKLYYGEVASAACSASTGSNYTCFSRSGNTWVGVVTPRGIWGWVAVRCVDWP